MIKKSLTSLALGATVLLGSLHEQPRTDSRVRVFGVHHRPEAASQTLRAVEDKIFADVDNTGVKKVVIFTEGAWASEGELSDEVFAGLNQQFGGFYSRLRANISDAHISITFMGADSKALSDASLNPAGETLCDKQARFLALGDQRLRHALDVSTSYARTHESELVYMIFGSGHFDSDRMGAQQIMLKVKDRFSYTDTLPEVTKTQLNFVDEYHRICGES